MFIVLLYLNTHFQFFVCMVLIIMSIFIRLAFFGCYTIPMIHTVQPLRACDVVVAISQDSNQQHRSVEGLANFAADLNFSEKINS